MGMLLCLLSLNAVCRFSDRSLAKSFYISSPVYFSILFYQKRIDLISVIKFLMLYTQFYHLPFYFLHIIFMSLPYLFKWKNQSLTLLIIIYTNNMRLLQPPMLIVSSILHISLRVISVPVFFTVYCFLKYKE